jgi:hypothetical protein
MTSFSSDCGLLVPASRGSTPSPTPSPPPPSPPMVPRSLEPDSQEFARESGSQLTHCSNVSTEGSRSMTVV